MEKEFIAFIENYYELKELPEGIDWKGLANWVLSKVQERYPEVEVFDIYSNGKHSFYSFLEDLRPVLFDLEKKRIGHSFPHDTLSIVCQVIDMEE